MHLALHSTGAFESLPHVTALAPDRVGLINSAARTISALTWEECLQLGVPDPIHMGYQPLVAQWLTDHPLAFDRLMSEWNPEGVLLEELVERIYADFNCSGILSLSAVSGSILMW